MSDNGEEEAEPVVELGDGPDVEGAPVSRVASRLFFPIERSEVLRREGGTAIRTPDGPRTVEDVLDGVDEVYFETNADLVNAVRSVVGTGPVPTAGGGSDSGAAAATDAGSDEADAEGDAEVGSGSGTDAEGGSDSADADGDDDSNDAGGSDAGADGDAEESGFEFDEE